MQSGNSCFTETSLCWIFVEARGTTTPFHLILTATLLHDERLPSHIQCSLECYVILEIDCPQVYSLDLSRSSSAPPISLLVSVERSPYGRAFTTGPVYAFTVVYLTLASRGTQFEILEVIPSYLGSIILDEVRERLTVALCLYR